MSDVWSELGDFGRDLLTRQVHLIVAPGGMTAEPMPETRVAVLQIACAYWEHINATTNMTLLKGEPDVENLTTTFNELRIEGERLTTTELADARPGEFKMHDRIRGHSVTIHEILERAGGDLTKVTNRDLVAIRKAWELGVDPVVLQTTVGLDGDVVTRVDARYTGPEHEPLFRLHEQSVAVSSRTWKDVIDAAIELVTKIFGRSGGAGGRRLARRASHGIQMGAVDELLEKGALEVRTPARGRPSLRTVMFVDGDVITWTAGAVDDGTVAEHFAEVAERSASLGGRWRSWAAWLVACWAGLNLATLVLTSRSSAGAALTVGAWALATGAVELVARRSGEGPVFRGGIAQVLVPGAVGLLGLWAGASWGLASLLSAAVNGLVAGLMWWIRRRVKQSMRGLFERA